MKRWAFVGDVEMVKLEAETGRRKRKRQRRRHGRSREGIMEATCRKNCGVGGVLVGGRPP